MYDFSIELNGEEVRRFTGGWDQLGAALSFRLSPFDMRVGAWRIIGNNNMSRKLITEAVATLAQP
jgi:hypothetical protein